MIKLIVVGKIKEKYIKEGINDYAKRIKKFDKIEIIELPDVNNEKCLDIEMSSILSKIKDREYVISLCIEGEMKTSEELASIIDKTYINYPTITFIIGGSSGLHEDIKKRSNLKLSFSKNTFPHQLFRLILLEQIYRACKINNNESYHK